MSIKLQCPRCQAKLVVREENASKAHRCPRCQEFLAIEGSKSATATAAAAPAASAMAATFSPTMAATGVPQPRRFRSRLGSLLKWGLISITAFCIAIPMLFLSIVGLASLLGGKSQSTQTASSSGSDAATAGLSDTASTAAYNAPVIPVPVVDTAAQEAAARNQAAWRQMDLCNNNNDRLSREAPLEYWEALRQGYGEIDVRNVDWEFATLVEEYRSLFLDYANTHRQWTQERQPNAAYS